MNPFQFAWTLYGLKEVPGSQSNKKLLDIIKSSIAWADDDSTISWCAIFMAYVFKSTYYNHLIPFKPSAARSWLNLPGEVIYLRGQSLDVDKLLPGDIVIFYRGSINGWKGHVAFYLNKYDYNKTKIRCYGGNQSNGALIRPYSKERILKIIRI